MKLLFIVALIACDILLAIFLAGHAGWGWVVAGFVLMALAGFKLIHSVAMILGPGLREGKLANGQDEQAVYGLCRAFSGVLLILPGYLSDVAGLVLLVPAVQRKAVAGMSRAMQSRNGRLQGVLDEVSRGDGK
ncbi:MAG TPA: FxsA family protein [Fluviicoccus sp.]|nr:FxsA family protein [Fluviicoccus sp.]